MSDQQLRQLMRESRLEWGEWELVTAAVRAGIHCPDHPGEPFHWRAGIANPGSATECWRGGLYCSSRRWCELMILLVGERPVREGDPARRFTTGWEPQLEEQFGIKHRPAPAFQGFLPGFNPNLYDLLPRHGVPVLAKLLVVLAQGHFSEVVRRLVDRALEGSIPAPPATRGPDSDGPDDHDGTPCKECE